VSFKTSVKNAESVRITAARMKLPVPQYVEKYRMRSGKEVTGLSLQLPGWAKPVVFDTESGNVEFDNWSPYDASHPQVRKGEKQVGDDGRWGDIKHLNQFVDEYLGTEVMLQAEAEGHTVTDCGWDAQNEQFRVRIKT
jgi:hypothetical protein